VSRAAFAVRDAPSLVRVSRDGVVLAESSRARVLSEGSYPARFYFPPEDVTVPLEPSAKRTTCPHKGRAHYWSARTGDGGLAQDIAWSYPDPLPGAEPIAGRVAFFNERVKIEAG
jgi:uncharacterized protein (DUF427 family)